MNFDDRSERRHVRPCIRVQNAYPRRIDGSTSEKGSTLTRRTGLQLFASTPEHTEAPPRNAPDTHRVPVWLRIDGSGTGGVQQGTSSKRFVGRFTRERSAVPCVRFPGSSPVCVDLLEEQFRVPEGRDENSAERPRNDSPSATIDVDDQCRRYVGSSGSSGYGGARSGASSARTCPGRRRRRTR